MATKWWQICDLWGRHLTGDNNYGIKIYIGYFI